MLDRAIATGRAPALARIKEDGVYVDNCVAAFPSVTPVCAASITTGVGPDEHLIPSMNWYSREESRYVEYGSSFSASRQFGVLRSLTDTVYRMNAEHLSHDVETVFETLDDADGPEAFLGEHAVIVVSDHSQAPVEERIRLDIAFADFEVATQSAARSVGAEVALSPAQRSAMIYALDEDRRDDVVTRAVDVVE